MLKSDLIIFTIFPCTASLIMHQYQPQRSFKARATRDFCNLNLVGVVFFKENKIILCKII